VVPVAEVATAEKATEKGNEVDAPEVIVKVVVAPKVLPEVGVASVVKSPSKLLKEIKVSDSLKAYAEPARDRSSSLAKAEAREAAWLAKQALNKPVSPWADDDAKKQAAKEKAEAREAAWLARQQAAKAH